MRREFLLQDDVSNKFWTIEIDGTTCVTTNGRVGARPRETRKTFPDVVSAQKELERQVAAKLRKGYVEGRLDATPEHRTRVWSELSMSELQKCGRLGKSGVRAL